MNIPLNNVTGKLVQNSDEMNDQTLELKGTDSPLTNVTGEFVEIEGEKFYQITNSDQMPAFFISVVSASDHWFFISSTGSLSAGRIRPENALFPYKSVDYIHESAENTGSKTLIKVKTDSGCKKWEPFNVQHDGLYQLQRNLYKNTAGDKIIFEEVNLDLGITFKYQWATSDQLGFIRSSTISNDSKKMIDLEIVDGIQNILPPGAPLDALQDRSALVDAYKWNELLTDSRLATYSMYAKLSDRADPAESLRATSVFSIGEDFESILLSSEQIGAFRRGRKIDTETLRRGLRGAYFIHKHCHLAAQQQDSWQIVADIDQTHANVVSLKKNLDSGATNKETINSSIDKNHQELLMLMAGSDAYQKTAQEETSVHHYANVLFNNMRGGVVADQYWVEKQDFIKTLTNSNQNVATKNQQFLQSLPERIQYQDLLSIASEENDQQLVRLCHEYLPLTFGRRHGDPSRPWNHFEIKVKDDQGEPLLSYQGNWRDIFQNWEALAVSYPHFIKSFIAKFVNASTIDGYNPYRITKEGVDWELLDLEDAWSNIGYWGDHQIIYLLKFLELSKKYQPQELQQFLNNEIFSYANVPYEIKNARTVFSDPKNTVKFNDAKQKLIEAQVEDFGNDGRLLLNEQGEVYLVNLTEKLLVPLLSKLSNLVIGGGIWLNTQRPEWNDANNAIVGTGLSMVTLYYMRRYVAFIQDLLKEQAQNVELSSELVEWLLNTTETLHKIIILIQQKSITRENSRSLLSELAISASEYRSVVYSKGFSHKVSVDSEVLKELLDVSLQVIDHSISINQREDGLYNAYNIINYSAGSVSVKELYPMLEGQVAVLSSGVLSSQQAVDLLDKLYASEMFREDQQSFMLYPDRDLTRFENKNKLSASRVNDNALLKEMAEKGDTRLVEIDADGCYHFNADFENAGFLLTAIDKVKLDYPQVAEVSITDILSSYEAVFNHQAFTGRSGTMFGYEGLGSIYWHMVSKLLLAVQENYFAAWEIAPEAPVTKQLAEYYYKVRAGIGFNKTPENYGAFPTDPYSHTPKQAGAQQPGMTGQVKEEILTRFGELGLIVGQGTIEFKPSLLKTAEFLTAADTFDFIDLEMNNQTIELFEKSLGFTYCQIPFVYQITEQDEGKIEILLNDKQTINIDSLCIDEAYCGEIFGRSGVIKKITVSIPRSMLMD
ncbi:MAG: hypothetical protein V7782_04885 [Psychromonas sp.]